MGTAAFILLVALLMRGGGSDDTPTTPEPDSGGGDTPPKPKEPGLLEAGLGLLGTGGLTAGAGAGGAGGTATLAGAGAAAGGSTPTAVGAPTVVGAVGGTAAIVPVGAITVGLLANPFAWAVYFLIASKVVQAQEGDKSWQSTLLNLNANARDLHGFEQALTRRMLTGVSFTELQQLDLRLERQDLGTRVKFQGWRTRYNFVPSPGQMDSFRKLRALALVYLRERSALGYRMIRYYGTLTPEPDWGLSESKLQTMFESPTAPGNMPGLGGLLHIPLAAGGATEQPRRNHTEYPSDPAQLRISPYVATPLNDLSAADLQLARFMALSDAIFALRFDPRAGADLDANHYARDFLSAIGTGPTDKRAPLEGLTTRDGLVITDPNTYGVRVAFNPQAIRQHTNAPGHEQLKQVTA